MGETYPVTVTKDRFGGYHYSVTGWNGEVAATNSRPYADANEAFTHGHNAERALRERERSKRKRGELDEAAIAIVLGALAA